MSGFEISIQWRTVTARENGATYNFPEQFTYYMRQEYSKPAVYRWRVMRISGEAKEPVYIGEAEDLVRRIQRVRTPSRKTKEGDTNRRLNKIFHEYLSAERKVVLDIADIEPFEINGVRFDKQGLGDRFKRRALENILLLIAQSSPGYELLNMVVDPIDKAERALKMLKPHQIREIIKHYGLDKPR